jgi:hypothetical protein
MMGLIKTPLSLQNTSLGFEFLFFGFYFLDFLILFFGFCCVKRRFVDGMGWVKGWGGISCTCVLEEKMGGGKRGGEGVGYH